MITGGEVAMPSDRPLDVSIRKLSIDGALGSKLDIGAGRIQVAAGGITAADLMADLLVGRNGGSWDGVGGIVSTAVASALAASRPRTIGWLTLDDGSLRIAAAAPGDLNLDGVVDLLDAANLLAGGKYDTGLPADWSLGDATYDGIVDILDASEFMGTGLYDAGPYDVAVAAGSVAAVPEPTMWPLIAVTIGLMAARGRRSGRVPQHDA